MTEKGGFTLIKELFFGVFLSQRSPLIMPSLKQKKENIDVQLARAFLHFCQNCL